MSSDDKKGDTHKGEVHKGTVKWFNEAKGYGFIEQANGRDLFVHYKEIRGKLNPGDKVEYVMGLGSKGPAATKVRVTERAPVTDATATNSEE